MKATAHWLELKGHTAEKPSTQFDAIFAGQVFETGKIEEGRILRQFFKRTKQSMFQTWLVGLVRGLVRRLPVGMLLKLGLAGLFRPRTRKWNKASRAIAEYVAEREAANLRAIGHESGVRR
jgi:heterodisulfide reductase subunit C